MTLIREGVAVSDPFINAAAQDEIPAIGAVIVSLEQWLAHLTALFARPDPIGIRLRSDQHPEVIADDLDHFAVIALEFPVFRDGRPYSYARLLRERWGYQGELRAVGDVLPDQLHFMHRAGFNAFELQGADPARNWAAAAAEFSAWYQATGDGRRPARLARHRKVL